MTVVADKHYASSDGASLANYLTTLWDWTGVESVNSYKVLWIDSEKTIGICVYIASQYFLSIGLYKNSSPVHICRHADSNTLNLKIEKVGNTVLIISVYSSSNSQEVTATNCEKYIICPARSAITGEEENIAIYLDSKASSNVSTMLASDVFNYTDISAQNSNANTNAKTTNLIPFYNPASAFITTTVYQSLCEDLSSWYFGNVIVNNNPYRMSGSVFVLDR